MVAKASGSKHKDPRQRERILNGEIVKPVLYNGQSVGHGKYFAGQVNEELVCDDNGVPLRLRDIGELVLISTPER